MTNNLMTLVRRLALAFVVSAALCVVCYCLVDRPVAEFAAHRLDVHPLVEHLFQAMAAPSLLSLPFGLAYLSALALKTGQTDRAWPHQSLLTQISVAILAATAAKDLLKWLFGRPWPDAFVNFGAYQFSPLNNGFHYGSFPSGHTAYIAAPLLVFAYARPKWRLACYALIGLVMVGLVGGGYHFPGDTIAGLFTGLAAAGGTLALMQGKKA